LRGREKGLGRIGKKKETSVSLTKKKKTILAKGRFGVKKKEIPGAKIGGGKAPQASPTLQHDAALGGGQVERGTLEEHSHPPWQMKPHPTRHLPGAICPKPEQQQRGNLHRVESGFHRKEGGGGKGQKKEGGRLENFEHSGKTRKNGKSGRTTPLEKAWEEEKNILRHRMDRPATCAKARREPYGKGDERRPIK